MTNASHSSHGAHPRARGPHDATPDLHDGTSVLVRNRFDGSFVEGFRIAGTTGDGRYSLRRYDGVVLPATFATEDVLLDPGVVGEDFPPR